MSTVVGKFVFDFDLEDMSNEKIEALQSECARMIQKRIQNRKCAEWADEFYTLNMRADSDGFDLCFIDDNGESHMLTCYNFAVLPKDREE